MKSAITVFCLLIATGFFGFASIDAQRPASEKQSVQIVEVVGCLTSAPNDTWVLTSASAPTVSDRPSTNTVAVKAAATKPLGKEQYRLLGLTPFRPADHAGHKVVVKGLLIKDQKETRINITSFHMVAADCAASSGNK